MKLHTRKIEVEVVVEDVKIIGSPLSPQQIKAIQDKHQKVIGRGAESRVVTDTVSQAADIFVAMVKEWDGALDSDGSPLECSEANKRLVFEFDQGFVESAVSAINAAVEELRRAERKN